MSHDRREVPERILEHVPHRRHEKDRQQREREHHVNAWPVYRERHRVQQSDHADLLYDQHIAESSDEPQTAEAERRQKTKPVGCRTQLAKLRAPFPHQIDRHGDREQAVAEVTVIGPLRDHGPGRLPIKTERDHKHQKRRQERQEVLVFCYRLDLIKHAGQCC